ncbi:hypothetical protein [Limosilactobacillus vaginalis]|uniref:hypothetical protein n=1 Tax=Limosilactobacillus vaginalis TaxID=1633 RepID=UPI003734F30B
MNYLQEILNFEKLQELNRLAPGQARVWYVLMYLNNITGWQSWFTVASSTLEFRSGLSRQGVIKARNELKQLGYIDFKTNGRSATSYHMKPLMQGSVQPSLQGSVQDSLQPSLHDGLQGSVQNSSALYKQNKTNNSDKSQATRHHTQQKFADDSVEMQLAMYLFSKIKENNPDHKKLTYSQKQKWADSIRLMIERDNRSPKQIKNMVDWCQADSFWKTNILSTAKLRKQYDAMKVKANSNYRKQGTIRREPIPGWMKEDLKKRAESKSDLRIQRGYVIPDDSMDPMPK